MNLFRDLPYDMQCVIVKKLDEIERKRLSWNIPITLLQKFTCINKYYTTSKKPQIFSVRSTIWCDKNGFVWMNTCVGRTFWINSQYNFKNVPLCSALTHSPKQIARILKRVFFEYVNYVYYNGKYNFANRIHSHFEMITTDFEYIDDGYIEEDNQDNQDNDIIMDKCYRLRTKDIERCIRREWFSNVGEQVFFMAKPHLPISQFYIQDGIRDIDTKDEYMPFSYETLQLIEQICPNIYKKLEEFGELKCQLLPMSNPIRQYIYWYKIYEKYKDMDVMTQESMEASQALHLLLGAKFSYLGYGHQDFPPSISDIFEYSNMRFLES